MTSTRAPQPFSRIRDTPPIQPAVVESGYRSGDLNQARVAVLQDLKRYLELPFSTFVDSTFGSPSRDECLRMRQALAGDGTLNVNSDGKAHWASFEIPPSKSRATESIAFTPLYNIINRIFAHIPNCRVSFTADPDKIPVSTRNNPSRPDATIILGSVPDKIHWFEIAVPFEFKKASGSRAANDNMVKTIWSLHDIMREDPLRRFVFGFTVENTKMKIWCSNRAFFAASSPIDIMNSEDVDDVISLFHSIGSKTAEELGWDPTVRRISCQGEDQYVFKVNNQFFTTTRKLATYGADSIIGRGVRVYEAKDQNGNVVAIKDSWREESREKEGAILLKILGDMQEVLGDKADEAEKYIIKARTFEDVSEGNDKTFSPSTKEGSSWISITSDLVHSPATTSSRKSQLPSEGLIPLDSASIVQVPQAVMNDECIPCRVHTRVVFEEVGTTLQSIDFLDDSLDCLSGAQKALGYLHQAGWVHRDVSVNNILWVMKNGCYTGKLTDFEYAKKKDSLSSHMVRTGTVNFMALEVEAQEYLFLPHQSRSSNLMLGDPAFQMNPLHDLESLWWCAIWILLHYTDVHFPAEDLNAQQTSLQKAFPGQPLQSYRSYFFHQFKLRERARNTLSKTYRDKCSSIFDLADTLIQAYEIMEKDYLLMPFGFPNTNLVDLHTKVSHTFRQVINELKESGYPGVKLRSLLGLIEAKQVAAEGSGTSNQPVEKKQRLA